MWQQTLIIIQYCRKLNSASVPRAAKRTAFAYRFCLFVESTKSGCEDSPAEMGLVIRGSSCTTPPNRNAVWPLVLLVSMDVAGPRLLTVTKGQTYTMNTVVIASISCFYLPQHCRVLVLTLLIPGALEQKPHCAVDYVNWMRCNSLKLLLDWRIAFC